VKTSVGLKEKAEADNNTERLLRRFSGCLQISQRGQAHLPHPELIGVEVMILAGKLLNPELIGVEVMILWKASQP